MPKKSAWGENSKAVEAKVRKAEVEKVKKAQKDQAKEDAYWEDDDKSLAKKQGRKEEQEKKRLEKLQRKQESKSLEETEKESIAAAANRGPAIQKVTQAQIAAEQERREAAARKATAKNNPATPKPVPLVENLNRLLPVEEATTVDEALKMLTVEDEPSGAAVDKHPERRMKAAYNAFEEARLPILKAENPSLRLSQLKQMIFDEWKKSPENPMNKSGGF